MTEHEQQKRTEALIKGTFSYFAKRTDEGNYCIHDQLDNCFSSIEEIQQSVRSILTQAHKEWKAEVLKEQTEWLKLNRWSTIADGWCPREEFKPIDNADIAAYLKYGKLDVEQFLNSLQDTEEGK